MISRFCFKPEAHDKRATLPGSSVILLVIAIGVSACVQQGNQPLLTQSAKSGLKEPSTGLELEISLSRNVYQSGTPILLEARFRNSGPLPLTIVKMVDRSIEGRRYPKYTLHLIDAKGVEVSRIRFDGCGNTNSLFEGDVVQILPRQTVDPFAEIDEYHFRAPVALEKMYNITKPGRYRVWLQYDYRRTDQLRVRKCVYQKIDEKLVDKSKLERIRPLHVPIPEILPLEIQGLKSNALIFEIIS
jgi:hypothetical protein